MNNENDPFAEAKSFEDQQKFDLAAEQYQKAVDLGIGDQSLAHQGRARALARLGRLEEALDECQKALKLKPDLPLVHGLLGYIYLSQAKYELAEKELLLAPGDTITLTNLVLVYSELGHYRKASELCEELLQRNPSNLDTRIHLARLYIAQSRFGNAMGQLNRILVAKPAMPEIYLLYSTTLMNSVGEYLKRNLVARVVVILGLYLIALLAPLFVSIPVGILLCAFVLLAVLTNLWGGKHKGACLLISLSFALGWYGILYWVLVWLHQFL
jgi:tetratricopeptide (TPR) repeat protein